MFPALSRTLAQGKAGSRCSLPATRGVGLYSRQLGSLGPGPQGPRFGPWGPLEGTRCTEPSLHRNHSARKLGKESSHSPAQRIFSGVTYDLTRGTSGIPNCGGGLWESPQTLNPTRHYPALQRPFCGQLCRWLKHRSSHQQQQLSSLRLLFVLVEGGQMKKVTYSRIPVLT